MTQVLPGSRRSFVPVTHRIISALFLHRELYDWVANDPLAMSQAVLVVSLSGMMRPSLLTERFGAWGMLISMLFALIGWLFFASAIVYPLARLITRAPIGYKRLLRCLGFAEAPGLLYLFHYFSNDPLPHWFRAGVWFWLLAASAVAIRAATGVTVLRATCIAVLSFILYLVVGVLTAAIGFVPS